MQGAQDVQRRILCGEHADQELVQASQQRRINHVGRALAEQKGAQLEQQQQSDQAQQIARPLGQREARQKGKDQIESELHRDRPGRAGHELLADRRVADVGEEQVQDILGAESVPVHRYSDHEDDQKQRKDPQCAVFQKAAVVEDTPGPQGDAHEQVAAQHEEQAHARMSLHQPAETEGVGMGLPIPEKRVEYMEHQHQQRRQATQMGQPRVPGKIA